MSRTPNALSELLFDRSPSPMWIVDLATHRLVSVNDAAVVHAGYSRVELLALRADDLYPKEDAALALRVIERPQAARHLKKDGTILDVLVRSALLDDDGREALLVVADDVTDEKREGDALRESERQFRALVEHGADGIGLYRDSGTAVYLNPAVTLMLGISREQVVGEMAQVHAHPEDRDRHRAEYQALGRTPGSKRTFESRARHQDGSWRWIESVVTNLTEEPSVRGIVSNFRDITERKNVEEALRDTRERLEFLLSATSALTYTCKVVGDFGATFMSENVTKVLGYEAREFVEDSSFWLGHVHPDDREPVIATMMEVFEFGRHTFEYRFLAKDGTYRWMHDEITLVRDERGEPKEMIGYWIDITARRDAEEALRRSEMNFRALTEQLPSGIIVHGEKGIAYVNPALVSMLGYTSAAELIGRPAVDLVHPDHREMVKGRVEITRQTGRTPLIENRLVRADGGEVIVEAEALFLTYDGKPANVVILHDLTERREIRARLALTDRMVSIGTLAAGVAHEINNPLAYVSVNLDLLSEELPALLGAPLASDRRARLTATQVAELLRDAREGAARVGAVVGELRALSRADEERSGPVDLRRVVEFAAKMAGNEIRHRARLVLDLADVPPAYANESRLGQVFLNLLVNAAQAIPDGHADDNEIRVVMRRDESGAASIEIKDTGCGIPPEIQGRIFDPFFTTKPMGVGIGLGLSICHGIVQSLGGTIALDSKVGVGSTFRIVLPVAVAEPVAKATAVKPYPRARQRILVVDDEASIGLSLKYLLANEHDVVAVTRAAAALARIDAGEEFDAILCDLMMPEMNGMDFYAELSRRAPRYVARIVFLTGGAFTTRAREFLELVPAPRLDKPFNIDGLRAALALVLR